MCLSVIGKVVNVRGDIAEVDLGGALKEVSTLLKPQAKKGDYALLHAGFIIEIMPPAEAKKALKDINAARNF